MGPARLKYLEMLQAAIARMGGNQFSLRTWSVALGTAIIGYAAAKDGNPSAAFIAILPALVFWVLDAYFLALEKRFRTAFEAAVKVLDDNPDFSFGRGPGASGWFAAAFRPAVFLVHLPVIVLACVVGSRLFPH